MVDTGPTSKFKAWVRDRSSTRTMLNRLRRTLGIAPGYIGLMSLESPFNYGCRKSTKPDLLHTGMVPNCYTCDDHLSPYIQNFPNAKETYRLSFSMSFHQTIISPPSKRSLASNMASKPLCPCLAANSECVNNSKVCSLVIPCEASELTISFSFLSSLNNPNGSTSFASICNPFSQNTLIPLGTLREFLWSSAAMLKFVTTRRESNVAYFGKFWESWTRVVNGTEEDAII